MTTLRITPRAANLTLTADPELDRPYRISSQGPAPTVREQGDEIDVSYTLVNRMRAMSVRGGSLTVALNPGIAWAIELRDGVSGLRADLRGVAVSELTVTGGAADVVVDLPPPSGELAVRIAGGVSNVVLRRPRGVPVDLEIDGGATELQVDDDHFGAVGGTVHRRTPGNGNGILAVRVGGGASRLTIAAHD